MIDCIVIGDSIAYGVSYYRKDCKSYVKSGINSTNWNRAYLHSLEPTHNLIISLGANDTRMIDTESNVLLIRNKTTAKKVFWILPSQKHKPKQYEIVKKVAQEYNDIIIERPETNISSDGIHPTGKGYKILAEKTK
jgi:lysophospholipase L1-like esterase